jgi:hypothetical protein
MGEGGREERSCRQGCSWRRFCSGTKGSHTRAVLEVEADSESTLSLPIWPLAAIPILLSLHPGCCPAPPHLSPRSPPKETSTSSPLSSSLSSLWPVRRMAHGRLCQGKEEVRTEARSEQGARRTRLGQGVDWLGEVETQEGWEEGTRHGRRRRRERMGASSCRGFPFTRRPFPHLSSNPSPPSSLLSTHSLRPYPLISPLT